MEKVRLVDIAERLGVSTVTVHNAIAGNKGVSEEMRTKILATAEEMGYQAPAIKKKNSRVQEEFKTIGVLIAEKYLAQYTTFYWNMYQELAMVATEKYCFTVVEVVKKHDEFETLKMPSCLEEERVDGLVVIGEMNKDYIRRLKKHSAVPVVFLDFYDKELARDAVVADNFYGMFLMTEYLFEQGIDELAYVGSIYATSSIMDRYCGFLKSMMLHHKPVNPEWIIEDRDEYGQMGFELPEKLPKGFVCNCDLAAYMLMDKLQERGIRVPEDVSVVGFDNYLYPGLADRKITTYEVNAKNMAKVALDKTLKLIQNPSRRQRLEIVSGHMVIKHTVKRSR